MLTDFSLLKNRFALKFIWLNFYTMKFSRFKFSVLLNVIILTQPVNIVKRFFLFHQVFIKSMENFQRCCFATAWLLYQTAYALSRTFLNFFRTFSSRPIRFRVATREKLVCSQATAWLYYHSLVFPSSTFRKLFLKISFLTAIFLSVPVLSLFPTCFIFGFCSVSVRLTARCQKCLVVNLI